MLAVERRGNWSAGKSRQTVPFAQSGANCYIFQVNGALYPCQLFETNCKSTP